MSLWHKLFGDPDGPKTFEQDLELMIARWTDPSRKRERTMSVDQIGEALLTRAEQALDRPRPKPTRKPR